MNLPKLIEKSVQNPSNIDPNSSTNVSLAVFGARSGRPNTVLVYNFDALLAANFVPRVHFEPLKNRRTPPGAGRFQTLAIQIRFRRFRRGLSPPYPPAGSKNTPRATQGYLESQLWPPFFGTLFPPQFLEHPFSVFFRPENIHNGSRAALGPPKIVIVRFWHRFWLHFGVHFP